MPSTRRTTTATNQLRSLLREFHPAALQGWQDLPGGILRAEARALLALTATPGQAAGLSKRKIADTIAHAGRFRLLDEHAARLQAVLQHKQLRHPPQVEAAMGQQVLAALNMLNQACTTVQQLTEQTTTAFTAHPHAGLYLSFPGCGELTGARLLAEIGDDPHRFTTARGLRAYAGAAPLTWESGTSRTVTHRRIANSHLKATGHNWAFTTLTRSPGCRAHYDHRRQAGDRYAAALRSLFGRLLSQLHHCLATGEHYREDIAFPQTRGERPGG